MTSWHHDFVQANGIKIHYITAGKGPLVLLLHGFPQFCYAWRHQIPALAGQFQVVAPDLRGYGDTDKPIGVSEYQSDVLAADIAGLIHALGYQKAHIIGHDWGGAVAWRLALDYPQVVDHLAVLNCPHPYVFTKALKSNFQQIRKSWYIFFFQISYLPEFILKMNLKKTLEGLFRGTAIRKEAFSDADIDQYCQAIKKPGALTAALNYYRAAFHKVSAKDSKEKEKKKITASTLLVWGENDAALGKELTYDMEALFDGPFSIRYIPNCSHWVNEEQPELVNDLLLQFLQQNN